jgi:hypothetical protein
MLECPGCANAQVTLTTKKTNKINSSSAIAVILLLTEWPTLVLLGPPCFTVIEEL